MGAEPSGMVILTDKLVGKARLVVHRGLAVHCLFSLPAFVPSGGSASGRNPHWAFRKLCLISRVWAEESLEVILRKMHINAWMREGDSGGLVPVWAP